MGSGEIQSVIRSQERPQTKPGGGVLMLLAWRFIMDSSEARGREHYMHSFALYSQSLEPGFSRKGNINFSKEALFGRGQFSKGLLGNGHQYSRLSSYEE